VLQRVGHTEAAVDLCRLAGLYPAGVICELLGDDGQTMRRDAHNRNAEKHGLTFITVADHEAHRLQNERLVHREARRLLGHRREGGASSGIAMTWTIAST
jgi:3,4-dihydroxy 2-butanone 4-phosphate synthase/GTP cyclohydrolase II